MTVHSDTPASCTHTHVAALRLKRLTDARHVLVAVVAVVLAVLGSARLLRAGLVDWNGAGVTSQNWLYSIPEPKAKDPQDKKQPPKAIRPTDITDPAANDEGAAAGSGGADSSAATLLGTNAQGVTTGYAVPAVLATPPMGALPLFSGGFRYLQPAAKTSSPPPATTVVDPNWTGLGGDNNWSTGANWDSTPSAPSNDGTADIHFAGTTRLTPVVDANNPWYIANITFDSVAGAFTVSGNQIAFNNVSSVLNQNSANNQIINNALLLSQPVTVGGTGAGTLTLGGVVSGTNKGITKNGTSNLTLTNANTYTGATSVTAGTLTLSGTAGAVASSNITISGGKLLLDNSTNTNTARVNNVTVTTGGDLSLTGNGSTSSVAEAIGVLTFDTGSSIVSLTGTGAGQVQSFAASSFVRSNRATGLVRGTSLGDGATNTTRLTLSSLTGLTQVGTTTSSAGVNTGTTKNLTIVPFLIGDTSGTGTGVATTANFVTYDTTSGLRKLGTGEQDAMVAAAATNDTTLSGATDHNVKVLKGIAATMTTGAKTFNSLVLSPDSATSTGAVTSLTGFGGGSDSLMLTSGTLLDAGLTANTIGGFSSIIFGNGEAVIHRMSGTGSLSINSPISVTSSGGLTKSGAGNLILTATNVYTGPTTINQGTLTIGNGTSGSLNSTGALTVTPQGTLSLNMATGGVLSNTITNNGTITKAVGTTVNEISSNLTTGTGTVTTTLSGGTLALSGNNSYSGATTITNGTLRAVANVGNTSGGVSSALSPNSALTFTPGGNSTTDSILQLRGDADTVFNTSGAITFNLTSLTYSYAININVDQATANGSGKTLTLGNFNIPSASGSGPHDQFINVTGANGYKLAIGDLATQGTMTVKINATTADLTIASITNNNASNTYDNIGSGATTVTGAVYKGTASKSLTITQSGSGSLTLSGTASAVSNASNGSLTTYNLTGGTLNVNNANALGGNGTTTSTPRIFNISGGTLDNTNGGVTVADGATKLTTNISGNFAFGGTNAVNLGTGNTVLSGARTITTTASTLTIGGVVYGGTVGGTDGSSLTKAGPGTLALSNIAFYTGGASVNNGTLLVNGAAVAQTSQSTTTTASATITGLANALTTLKVGQPVSGSTIPTGSYITSITSANTIVISQTATAGATTLTFSAGSALGTGTVTVSGTGTLGGAGAISGAVSIQSGGTLAPGNSGVGTITLGNNLALNSLSTLALDVNGGSPNTADLVSVTGTTSLAGALKVTPGGTTANLNNTTSLTVVNSTSTLSGAFSNVAFGQRLVTTDRSKTFQVTQSGNTVVLGNFLNAATIALSTASPTNVRTGSTTANLYVANTSATGATVSDNLNYTLTGGITGTGTRAPGGPSDAGDLKTLTFTAVAGPNSPISVTATDPNASNIGGTATLTVTPTGYDYANPSVTTTTVDLGLHHVQVAPGSVSSNIPVSNLAKTNASYQDSLDVSGSSTNTLVAVAVGTTNIAAGPTSGSLGLSADLTVSGTLASAITVTLTSNSNGVAGLDNGHSLGTSSVSTTGGVFSGQGTWTGSTGGSWGSLASSNWTDSNGVQAAPGTFGGYTTTDTATFGNTSGSVTVHLNGQSPSLHVLAFNSTGHYTLDAAGGALILNNGASAATITVAGSHVISAPVTLNSNVEVTVTSSGDALTLSGGISGSGKGLTKLGAGTLTLSGTNGYSGNTTIQAGTLALSSTSNTNPIASPKILVGDTAAHSGAKLDVSGITGGFQVQSGQTLAGFGTVQGNTTVLSGGFVNPGDVGSIGTLSLDSLTVQSGGTLVFEVAGTSQYDQIVISSASTASATSDAVLRLDAINGFYWPTLQVGDKLSLFSGGTRTLNFASIVTAELAPGLTWNTSKLNSDGYITVATAAVPEPAGWLMGVLAAIPAVIALRRRRRTKITKIGL